MLSDLGRTRDEIAAVASGVAGRTTVGAMVVAIPDLLSRALDLLKSHSAKTTVLVEEGDLKRLLPRLRVGELDLFVGRLEPAYIAPDLEAEPLFDEPMRIIARPDHELVRCGKSSWASLAAQPWVVTPPWASSRTKLNQVFYKQKLDPPMNVVESASFLVTLTVVRERRALGFVAQSVARYLEREGLAKSLAVKPPIDVPPVGSSPCAIAFARRPASS